MMKNKIIDSELKVDFKNGKTYTFKRVLKYNPIKNWSQFEIVTKGKDGEEPYVKVLDMVEIKSIQETLRRNVRTSER